jgi:hypothetical protein
LFYLAVIFLLAISVALFGVGNVYMIAHHGITEVRYVMTAGVVWFVVVAALMISRRAGPLFKPLSMAAILIFASHGPWSAPAVATHSQVKIPTELLAANTMLVDGEAVPPSMPLAADQKAKISEVMDYLLGTGKMGALYPIFAPGRTPGEFGDRMFPHWTGSPEKAAYFVLYPPRERSADR